MSLAPDELFSKANVVDVAVVGAGAAGLATAIFAARRQPQLHIAALDGAKKLGAKILVAGGGRCNVTNEHVEPRDFWGGSRNTVKQILAAFPASLTVNFFREIGVEMHAEEHGKLFPNSNSAKTVLYALLEEAQRLGVALKPDHRVTGVSKAGPVFEVETSQGLFHARCIVLATGGLSLPKTGSDGSGYALAQKLGHRVIPTTPGLVPFILEGDFHAQLSGIAHDVELDVRVEGEKPFTHAGAMLWTHFGVSGPAILDVSRHWHRAVLENKPVRITVNFCPGMNTEQLDAALMALAQTQPRTILENALATLIPARLAAATTRHLGIDGRTVMAHLGKNERHKLAASLTKWLLPIRDSRGYNFAEVTAGGVGLQEIDPRTMQSRICPGLFLVGEILDVDGRIGGFNFQWAWSSGFVSAIGIEKFFSTLTLPFPYKREGL